MIYIKNLRTDKPPQGRSNHVKVCRTKSPLGNPFPMRTEADRDRVCDQYETWLEQEVIQDGPVRRELQRLTMLARQGDLYLYCWCASKRCHAETVQRWIEEQLRG